MRQTESTVPEKGRNLGERLDVVAENIEVEP